MTSSSSDPIADGPRSCSSSTTITALAGFLAGAVVGGRLGSLMSQKSRERLVRVAVFGEAILLLLAGFALEGFEIAEATPSTCIYSIIVLTAIAMGLRNATVRRLAVPDLTTTVLTMTVTGSAADSSLAAGNNPRVGYRLVSIFLMLEDCQRFEPVTYT